AAFSVNVRATKARKGRPPACSKASRNRSVNTMVLPQPAPALRATLASVTASARRCWSVKGKLAGGRTVSLMGDSRTRPPGWCIPPPCPPLARGRKEGRSPFPFPPLLRGGRGGERRRRWQRRSPRATRSRPPDGQLRGDGPIGALGRLTGLADPADRAV